MVAIHKWGCGVKQDNPGDVLHQCGLWWRGRDWQGLPRGAEDRGGCRGAAGGVEPTLKAQPLKIS